MFKRIKTMIWPYLESMYIYIHTVYYPNGASKNTEWFFFY